MNKETLPCSDKSKSDSDTTKNTALSTLLYRMFAFLPLVLAFSSPRCALPVMFMTIVLNAYHIARSTRVLYALIYAAGLCLILFLRHLGFVTPIFTIGACI